MKKILLMTLAAVILTACRKDVQEDKYNITSKFRATYNIYESFTNNDDGSITYNASAWGGLVGIIKERNLDAFNAMTVLAHLSAGYVHQMQMLYDDMGATEVVEETFQHIFTTFLTSYDMERVAKEVEKTKRENLN